MMHDHILKFSACAKQKPTHLNFLLFMFSQFIMLKHSLSKLPIFSSVATITEVSWGQAMFSTAQIPDSLM